VNLEGPSAIFSTLEATRGNSSSSQAGVGTSEFLKTLSQAIRDVNQAQLQSGAGLNASIRGNGPPLHVALAQAEEAGLAFQLTMQLRNKALEAYQEILRMQF
jgi:flagellar hook-basal body complex protein FliE